MEQQQKSLVMIGKSMPAWSVACTQVRHGRDIVRELEKARGIMSDEELHVFELASAQLETLAELLGLRPL